MNHRKLDFTPVMIQEIPYRDLVANLDVADLRELTNSMIDTMLDLITDCVDANVTFEPLDPDADDTYAIDDSEREISWTLAHVIVHTTATAEGSAATAAELARGVEFHGRSRSEVPWRSITTIDQCRHRLEESRRMRLASLDMWPDRPYLDNRHTPYDLVGEIDAIGQFILGLFHDDMHLAQIVEIARQAKTAQTV